MLWSAAQSVFGANFTPERTKHLVSGRLGERTRQREEEGKIAVVLTVSVLPACFCVILHVWLKRCTDSGLVHRVLRESLCVCVRKGERMTEGQVERRLLSLTQHLSHFITKSSMTNSSGVWQRWGRQDKSWDESSAGHLRTANVALVM